VRSARESKLHGAVASPSVCCPLKSRYTRNDDLPAGDLS
jgi:hypothetical protein